MTQSNILYKYDPICAGYCLHGYDTYDNYMYDNKYYVLSWCDYNSHRLGFHLLNKMSG